MTNIPKDDYDKIKGLAGKVYLKSFTGIEYDDLLQEGLLAYLKAKKRYNEDKNDFFLGYAYKRVYGAMLDWVGKQAYNKGKAVRKTIKEPNYKVVPAPENVELYAINDDKELDRLLLQDDIVMILMNRFTIFEIKLLFEYLQDSSKCFSEFKDFLKRKQDMIDLVTNILIDLKGIMEYETSKK